MLSPDALEEKYPSMASAPPSLCSLASALRSKIVHCHQTADLTFSLSMSAGEAELVLGLLEQHCPLRPDDSSLNPRLWSWGKLSAEHRSGFPAVQQEWERRLNAPPPCPHE